MILQNTIAVKHPGFLTTVQDLGRYGYGSIGMPVAGVMDAYAARVANILLRNDENAAVLEMTLLGPVLEFYQHTACVIAGGNLQPHVNERAIPLWTVFQVQSGDKLSFSGVASGCRAYLSVAGGFDVPLVMGSASTYLRGKIGGFKGRTLQAGDALRSGTSTSRPVIDLRLPAEYIPDYGDSVRTILGPQNDAFTQKGINTFLSSEYIVTHAADRMGYRLDGPVIEHRTSADIISDGIALGAIQVPAHGTPIIMLADRQTTGGYPKIAYVISVDIPLIAQKKPGDRLRFTSISVEEAQQIYREREHRLAQLIHDIHRTITQHQARAKDYTLNVNGHQFHAHVEEIDE